MTRDRPRLRTLLLIRQPGRPDRVVIWDTQEITLGRAPESDLVVDLPEVSRNHARFVRTEHAFEVHNQSTSNGTLVNGELVRQHALQNQDEVRIADLTIQFQLTPNSPLGTGVRTEYASQLKSGFRELAAADAPSGEATMLGLVDAVSDANDESFRVQPARDFEYELCDIERPDPGAIHPTRDLDLELRGFGLEEGVDPVAPPKTVAGVETEPWTLPDDSLDGRAGAPRPAAPAPEAAVERSPAVVQPASGAAAAVAGAPGASASLALRVRISGPTEELRRVLLSLSGRPLDLSGLSLRLDVEDPERR